MVWKMDNEDEVARLAQALKLIKDIKALSELEDKVTRLNKEVAELETKIAEGKMADNQLRESINELTCRRNELRQSTETQSESCPASAAGG
jgi:cell division septum initiation protein DivIVA